MQTNRLFSAPPFAVEDALQRFGANLRIARIRRGLTLQEVAERIGVSRFVVAGAENGKPTTGLAVHVALLWTYDLLGQFAGVADSANDQVGMALARAKENVRARAPEALDDDF